MEGFDVFGDGDFDEFTIDAVADAEVVGEGFDVDVGGALVECFADDLVDEFHDAGFGVFIGVDDVGFVLRVGELVVVEVAAFEDLFEGIGADAVESAEGFVDAFAGGHAPVEGDVEFLGGGLVGDEVEGVEGGEDEAALVAFAFDGDGEEAVFEGDAGAAGFTEGVGVFLCGDVFQPRDAEVFGEFAEVRFFIDESGVEEVIDG